MQSRGFKYGDKPVYWCLGRRSKKSAHVCAVPENINAIILSIVLKIFWKKIQRDYKKQEFVWFVFCKYGLSRALIPELSGSNLGYLIATFLILDNVLAGRLCKNSNLVLLCFFMHFYTFYTNCDDSLCTFVVVCILVRPVCCTQLMASLSR